MSKLAHSHQPTMDEIERRKLSEPAPNDDPPDDDDSIPVNLHWPDWLKVGAREVDILCNHKESDNG